MPNEKLFSPSDRHRPSNQKLATPVDGPAVAQQAEQEAAGEPAQVTPAQKKAFDRHPEDFPPPGDMGANEGPGS